MLGDLAAAADAVERTLAACAEEPNPGAELTAKVFRGWLLTEQGQPEAGIEEMSAAIERLGSTGLRLGFLPMALGMLADAYAAVGRLADAQHALDESEAMSDAENFRANTLRRRAELLVRSGAADEAVEKIYKEALACAGRQGTRAFELRAALSYARWLRDRGRGAEVHALLSPLHAALSERFDTRDLRQAGALLDDLQESDRNALDDRTTKAYSSSAAR
jgi:adenylate cyclase